MAKIAAKPTYVVLGGAGAMGQITFKDLVETAVPGSKIILADYNLTKAQQLAKACGRKGVSAVQVNINEPEAAREALKGSSVILSSLPHEHNLKVMELALNVGAHYTDLGGLFHVTKQQMPLHSRFEKAGLTAILGMGAAPGITNLLARLAAQELDELREIHIRLAAVDRTRYKGSPALSVSYSFKTIMEEFSLQPMVLSKGRYKALKPMSGADPYRFPSPVGVQKPMFTLHSEVYNLAESYKERGVQEVSFKIAFDAEFVERVRFLRDLGLASHDVLEINGAQIAPIDLVNRVVMSQTPAIAVSEPRQFEVLRTVVKGLKDNQKMTWINDVHTAGMPDWGIGTDIDTGSPPAVAAQLISSGHIKQAGVFPPEQIVPTQPFFAELAKRGMSLHQESKKGWSHKV